MGNASIWTHWKGVVADDVLLIVNTSDVSKLRFPQIRKRLQQSSLSITYFCEKPAAEGHWIVKVDAMGSLGMSISPGLRVLSIELGYIIDKWNLSHPMLAVRPGHRIVQVNDQSHDVLTELTKPGVLKIAMEEDEASGPADAEYDAEVETYNTLR